MRDTRPPCLMRLISCMVPVFNCSTCVPCHTVPNCGCTLLLNLRAVSISHAVMVPLQGGLCQGGLEGQGQRCVLVGSANHCLHMDPPPLLASTACIPAQHACRVCLYQTSRYSWLALPAGWQHREICSTCVYLPQTCPSMSYGMTTIRVHAKKMLLDAA